MFSSSDFFLILSTIALTVCLLYSKYDPIDEVVSQQNTTSTIPAAALLEVLLGAFLAYTSDSLLLVFLGSLFAGISSSILLRLFLGTGAGAGAGAGVFFALCFSVSSGFLFTTFLSEAGADFFADVSFFAELLLFTTGLVGLIGVFFVGGTGVFFLISLTTLGTALPLFG